jgi:phosphoheptose isomerase
VNRPSLPAIALTADSTVLTCIANDYFYEEVFSRQVKALGRSGDVLVAFSTSGTSPNVLKALEVARDSHLKSIALLGCEGGTAWSFADCSLIVRDNDTARIQEGHLFLMHVLMDYIESEQQGE